MGLLKSKTLTNGIIISYWRIINLRHVAKDGKEVVVGGFVDKTASDNLRDQAVLDVENRHVALSKDQYLTGNVYEAIYTLLKVPQLDENGEETNFFADAEDV
jgi:hypothetical protein